MTTIETIEVPKDLVYKLIVDMEDNIYDLALKINNNHSNLPDPNYTKYLETKKNLFELKKIYLKNK